MGQVVSLNSCGRDGDGYHVGGGTSGMGWGCRDTDDGGGMRAHKLSTAPSPTAAENHTSIRLRGVGRRAYVSTRRCHEDQTPRELWRIRFVSSVTWL